MIMIMMAIVAESRHTHIHTHTHTSIVHFFLAQAEGMLNYMAFHNVARSTRKIDMYLSPSQDAMK